MSGLRIRLNGTVREDKLLKKYLASHGKYFERAELVRGGETRVERTPSWGYSKRLRFYEADCVMNVCEGVSPDQLPDAAVVERRMVESGLGALAQIAVEFGVSKPEASALIPGGEGVLAGLIDKWPPAALRKKLARRALTTRWSGP